MSNETRKSKGAEFNFMKRVTARNLRALYEFHSNPQAFVRNCLDWLNVQAPKKRTQAPVESPGAEKSSPGTGGGE